MDIINTETQVNNVFQSSIMTVLTPTEVIFVEAYTEPQIQLGGSFSYVKMSVTYDFTLPLRLAGMRNGVPFIQPFDANTDPDAALKMAAWAAQIISLLGTAKTTLMALPTPNTPDVTYTTV